MWHVDPAMSQLQGLSHYRGVLLCFCNSCQLNLHLQLSFTNSILICTIVGYHFISPSVHPDISLRFSELLISYHWHILCQHYSVITVDINSDSLLFISTLDFVFQGTGMHRTIFIIYHMFIPCLRNYL